MSGWLGTPGGPQAWDFLNGPQDVVFRFDYRPVTETGYAADFPDARLAMVRRRPRALRQA